MPGTRSCCLVDVSGRYGNVRSECRDERGFHAGSSKFFVLFSDPRVGSDPRGAGTIRTPRQAAVSKFERGGYAGQIRGVDPRVSQKHPAGHGGLARE